MARSNTAAATDVVAEIAALVPQSRAALPWWEKIPPDVASLLPGVIEAFKDGSFGPSRRPAAKGISAWLAKRGVVIGVQGVETWLARHVR